MNQDMLKNKEIKEVFENREISPSKNSWNKLSTLLDEQMPVQPLLTPKDYKISYKKYLGIAAVFICAFGFLFWILQRQVKAQINQQVLVKTETKNTIEIPNQNIQTNSNTTINQELKKISPSKNSVTLPQKILATSTPIIEHKLEISNIDSVSNFSKNKPVNKIQIAWEPIQKKELEINTNNLVRSIEKELNQNHIETELNKPKDRFEQIRLAISNRNVKE